jgi:hypothetical protein
VEEESDSELSDEYSQEMQSKMGTALTYVHEDGMNYHQITPDIIVGSCLQTAGDVDRYFRESDLHSTSLPGRVAHICMPQFCAEQRTSQQHPSP